MQRGIAIEARWDEEANVWVATSEDGPGLVVEADSWSGIMNEIELVLPDLIELSAPRQSAKGS